MEEDTVHMETERSERIRRLLEQQGKEIEKFDDESLRMGFSTVVITNYGDQVRTGLPSITNYGDQVRTGLPFITNYGDQVFVDPHVRQQSDAGRSRSQHPVHVSASSSALPVNHLQGYNIPRSNSGANIRHGGSLPQHSGDSSSQQPNLHRSTRANSEIVHRSNSPAQFTHQRQSSAGGSRITNRFRQTGNVNRNNSARVSPNTQRRLVDPNDSMSSQGSSGRSSPMMGQRFVGTVAVDEHAPAMLQRAAANWSGGDSRQVSNAKLHNVDDRHQSLGGAAHYGSMSSLSVPPGPQYSHQRTRAGRSLDEGDPTTMSSSSSYGLLSSNSGDDRINPVRRAQTFGDKSTISYNGRNSPRMGPAPNPQSNMRYRQLGGPQSQQHPDRMSGTSFSSSFH